MPLTALWNQAYTFLRHRGASHHDAQDWTQDVFTSLASKGLLTEDGRIAVENSSLHPSYVLTMARTQMIDHHRAANALKRKRPNSKTGDERLDSAEALSPAEHLVRNEAQQSWDRQLDRLGNEIKQPEKKALFLHVRPWLIPGERSENLTKLARESKLSATMTKVQIHRWRKCLIDRFRKAYDYQTAA